MSNNHLVFIVPEICAKNFDLRFLITVLTVSVGLNSSSVGLFCHTLSLKGASWVILKIFLSCFFHQINFGPSHPTLVSDVKRASGRTTALQFRNFAAFFIVGRPGEFEDTLILRLFLRYICYYCTSSFCNYERVIKKIMNAGFIEEIMDETLYSIDQEEVDFYGK